VPLVTKPVRRRPIKGGRCDFRGGCLARTQRRRRIRCRLPCQVIQRPRRTIPAAVLSLSEGGFGLETTERVEQGDPIRLHIQAQGTAPAVRVEAIVWYDNPSPRARRNGELRLLGCFLPNRSPAFLELFAAVEKRNAPPEPPTRAARTRSAREQRLEDPDLPRSRAPLVPRKPEPEEALPGFRVRLRQIGGPRTRFVSVRAASIAQAAERVRAELSGPARGDADGWEVLEITPSGDSSAERRA
jgi:hypothetical protein